MPIHAFNLLLRSAIAIPGALGSTWLGLLFPVASFIIAQIVFLLVRGPAKMRAHWKQNVVEGLAVAGAAWSMLFLWCVVTTTYGDHVQLNKHIGEIHTALVSADSRQNAAVGRVVEDLGGRLSALQTSCSKIDGANEVLIRQTTAQQSSINNCQTQALKLLIPEAQQTTPLVLDEPSGTGPEWRMRWLLMTNKIVTPLTMIVRCNQPLSTLDFAPVGTDTMVGAPGRISQDAYQLFMSLPAWDKNSPLVVTMTYRGKADLACEFSRK